MPNRSTRKHALEARRHANVRRQMVLADKRWPRKITKIERLDLFWPYRRVAQGVFHSLYRQGTQIAVRERAKSGLSNANHGNRSHIS